MKRTIFHILLLTATATVDSHTTNALKQRYSGPGMSFHEYNPLMQPFAGKRSIYIAMPVGDLAVYALLRKKHRERAADAFVYGTAATHIVLAINNHRQAPRR